MSAAPFLSSDAIRHLAARLAEALIDDVMPLVRRGAVSFDDAEPSVSIGFTPTGGGPKLRMTLTLATDNEA